MDSLPLTTIDMSKQVSIRIQIDESTKKDFDLLLRLKDQTISENLREAISAQITQHKDLLDSIRTRFEANEND
jgi:DNA-directed RNA polymerase subunit L